MTTNLKELTNPLIPNSELIPNSNNNVESRVSLNDLISEFLENQDISEASKETYRTALSGLFLFLDSLKIKTPTRVDLINYKKELCKNHAAKTVNLHLSVIRNFFKWTHFYGIYPDISFGVKGVRDDKEPKRQSLTSSQVRSILNNIDTDSFSGRQKYAIVLLSSTTGLRAAEISSLNVGDLSTIHDQTVLSVKGKGHIDKGQLVAIGDYTEEAIRKALSLRKHLDLDDPLFISTSNYNFGKRISPKGISRLLKKILRENNFNGKFYTGHSFRHTACCLGLEVTDHDLVGVKRFMRHSNIETTMVYANHGESVSGDIARGIEEKLKLDET